MDFEEKTLAKREIYTGKIIDVYEETVLLPNGKEAKREIVRHSGAVGIMVFLPDEKMLFVKQFRKPLDRTTLEIPAGKIDPTDKNHLETAERELEEETKLAGKLTYVVSFYSSPGFADEILYIYRADDVSEVVNPRPQDADEFLELVPLTLTEAKQAVAEGLICDAKTIYALSYWENQQNAKK